MTSTCDWMNVQGAGCLNELRVCQFSDILSISKVSMAVI